MNQNTWLNHDINHLERKHTYRCASKHHLYVVYVCISMPQWLCLHGGKMKEMHVELRVYRERKNRETESIQQRQNKLMHILNGVFFILPLLIHCDMTMVEEMPKKLYVRQRDGVV